MRSSTELLSSGRGRGGRGAPAAVPAAAAAAAAPAIAPATPRTPRAPRAKVAVEVIIIEYLAKFVNFNHGDTWYNYRLPSQSLPPGHAVLLA